MKRQGIYIGIVLLLIVLPTLYLNIIQADYGDQLDDYEVLFKNTLEPMTLDKSNKLIENIKPAGMVVLSEIENTAIDGRNYGQRYIYQYGDTFKAGLEEGENRSIKSETVNFDEYLIDRVAANRLFLTEEIKGNTLETSRGDIRFSNSVDLSGLTIGTVKTDLLRHYIHSQEKPVAMMYVSGVDETGQKITDTTLQSALVELGVDDKDFDIMKPKSVLDHYSQITVTFLFILAVMMLIYALRMIYKNRELFMKLLKPEVKQQPGVSMTAEEKSRALSTGISGLLIVIACSVVIGYLDLMQLPLEHVNENMVSLTFYLNTFKALPVKLYGHMSRTMTYQYFKLDTVLSVAYVCYIAAFVMIITKLFKFGSKVTKCEI